VELLLIFFSYPLIIPERSGVVYQKLNALANTHNQQLKCLTEINSIIAVVRLLLKGTGVAFLPEYSIEHEIKNKELSIVNVDVDPQYYYSQILYHKGKAFMPFMERFIELIREARPEDIG